MNLNTPEGVVELMRSSRSEAEWEVHAKMVKEFHGGKYPHFWFDTIVRSGLMNEIGAKFGNPELGELKILVGDEALKDLKTVECKESSGYTPEEAQAMVQKYVNEIGPKVEEFFLQLLEENLGAEPNAQEVACFLTAQELVITDNLAFVHANMFMNGAPAETVMNRQRSMLRERTKKHMLDLQKVDLQMTLKSNN